MGTTWIGKNLSDSPTWTSCLQQLEAELPPQEFNTWIRPLQALETSGFIRLLAPNSFVYDALSGKYAKQIKKILANVCNNNLKLEMFRIQWHTIANITVACATART